MAKEAKRLTLMIEPDATGMAFDKVKAIFSFGTSDDSTMQKTKEEDATGSLTGQQVTDITAIYDAIWATCKSGEGIA